MDEDSNLHDQLFLNLRAVLNGPTLAERMSEREDDDTDNYGIYSAEAWDEYDYDETLELTEEGAKKATSIEEDDRKVSDFMTILKERGQFTNDFSKLDREADKFLVFVYGTLKRGYGNNRLLNGAEYLGTGNTVVSSFSMFDVGFPVVMDDQNADTNRQGSVYGEVWAVDIHQLAALDQLEANGFMYNRKEMSIILRGQHYGEPSQNARPVRRCFMYIGNDGYWGDSEDRELQIPSKMNEKNFLHWSQDKR